MRRHSRGVLAHDKLSWESENTSNMIVIECLLILSRCKDNTDECRMDDCEV